MSTAEHDQGHRRKGRARRFAAAMARPQMYLLLLVPAVATALVMTLLPTGISLADAAPSDDGISWHPGQIEQDNNGGLCDVTFEGLIGSPDITNIISALDSVPEQTVNQDHTSDYHIANVGEPDTAGTDVTGEADVDCSTVQTAFHTRMHSAASAATAQLLALTRPAGVVSAPKPGARASVVTPANDPAIYLTAWYTGAIADAAATAAYIAVSAVAIGGLIALGATLGPAGELASAALGALAGCIGGAVSTAILLAIGGGSTSPLATVTNAAAGCVTGAALSQIPVHSAGQWIGSQLGALLGTESAVVGASVESAASSAGVSLSPVAEAVQDAVSGLQAL